MVGESDTARARISRRILWNKEKFTFDEWPRAAFDRYVIEAETEIPRLAERWEAVRQSDAPRAAKLARAIAELRAWDHISRDSSVPMTLFSLWFWKQDRDAKAKQDPVGTLEGIVSGLEKDFGTWEAPWGEVNRLQRAQSGGEEPFSDARERAGVRRSGAGGDCVQFLRPCGEGAEGALRRGRPFVCECSGLRTKAIGGPGREPLWRQEPWGSCARRAG